mgnify:CR=1 FL=1
MISKDQKTASPEIENKMSVDQIESSGTVIANDTRFKGTITCRDQILVAGIVEGDIDCGGIVWIAKKGKIYANVYARKAVSYTHLTLPTTGHECRSRWSRGH